MDDKIAFIDIGFIQYSYNHEVFENFLDPLFALMRFPCLKSLTEVSTSSSDIPMRMVSNSVNQMKAI